MGLPTIAVTSPIMRSGSLPGNFSRSGKSTKTGEEIRGRFWSGVGMSLCRFPLNYDAGQIRTLRMIAITFARTVTATIASSIAMITRYCGL